MNIPVIGLDLGLGAAEGIVVTVGLAVEGAGTLCSASTFVLLFIASGSTSLAFRRRMLLLYRRLGAGARAGGPGAGTGTSIPSAIDSDCKMSGNVG